MDVKKFTVNFTGETYNTLDNLATELGMSKADVIRLSLSIMRRASDARRNQEALGIIKGNKVLRELVIPH